MRVASVVAGVLGLTLPIFFVVMQLFLIGPALGFVLSLTAIVLGWPTRKQGIGGVSLGIVGVVLTGIASVLVLLAYSAP